jgi:ABC-type protease/lipase transport system fused ATPase/permease subunit
MKTFIWIAATLLVIMLLVGMLNCAKKGILVNVSETIDDYYVEKLFKKDNCTVFRFYDGGRDHYFTDCTETISSYSCGKNCVRDENIGGKK